MSDSREKLAAFVLACYAEVLDVFRGSKTELVSWFCGIFSCNLFEADFLNVMYNHSSSFLILATFLFGRQTFL